MPRLLTVTDLQKNIGKIDDYVEGNWVIVTSRGKPIATMLPYFENNDDVVEKYLEAYRNNCHKDSAKKK
jgi:antitoxin (DNA-binding transcriptional repressor) of toxin-antitoxin stability system